MKAQVKVPQSSPLASYQKYSAEIDAAISGVLASGQYILGGAVRAFEKQFATFHHVPHCIGVGNGTDALQIALQAVGVSPLDGVVTTAHSSPATASAIIAVGAVPILVDVDPKTGLIDPERVEDILRERSSKVSGMVQGRIAAIVPVHLYGRCADMNAICDIANRYTLKIVEDCAQAHGAKLNEQLSGTFGDLGCFSFYPTKNLGALGDGGAVITRDPDLAARVMRLRQYGWERRDESLEPGINSRLDELQAAILSVKLPHLADENAIRRQIARHYGDGISRKDLVIPSVSDDQVFHQYAVRSKRRDDLRNWLRSNEIDTAIHYPIPAHFQPAFRGRVYAPESGLPESEAWAREVLSLPMFPQMSVQQRDHVIAAITTWSA